MGACSNSDGDTGAPKDDTSAPPQTVEVILVLERPGDLEQDLLTMYEHPTTAQFLSFSDTVGKYGMSSADLGDLKSYLENHVFTTSGWTAADYYADPTGTFVTVMMDEDTITSTFPDAKTGST